MAITAIKMVQEMNDQPLVIEPLGVQNVVRIIDRDIALIISNNNQSRC